MITVEDVISFEINKDDLNTCIENAKNIVKNIVDRHDLHDRDDLERFNNLLMGEIAEMMVLRWLQSQDKYAISTVDKNSATPDNGHDLQLKDKNGNLIKCSIKSSLSALKDLEYILKNFKLATKKSELRDVNIQVYFWLTIHTANENESRKTVLSLKNSAIIGWFGSKDIVAFDKYATEVREVPKKPLNQARSMQELLNYLS